MKNETALVGTINYFNKLEENIRQTPLFDSKGDSDFVKTPIVKIAIRKAIGDKIYTLSPIDVLAEVLLSELKNNPEVALSTYDDGTATSIEAAEVVIRSALKHVRVTEIAAHYGNMTFSEQYTQELDMTAEQRVNQIIQSICRFVGDHAKYFVSDTLAYARQIEDTNLCDCPSCERALAKDRKERERVFTPNSQDSTSIRESLLEELLSKGPAEPRVRPIKRTDIN